MLRRHYQLVLLVRFVTDAVATATAMWATYWLRFESNLLPLVGNHKPLADYVTLAPLALGVCLLTYRFYGLYEPRRLGRFIGEVHDIIKGTLLGTLGIIALTFFLRSPAESRAMLGLFVVLNPLMLLCTRGTVRALMWKARQRGYNLRHALVIGTGEVALQLTQRLQATPWTGVRVLGHLRVNDDTSHAPDLTVLGAAEDVVKIVSDNGIDQVFVAVGHADTNLVAKLVGELEVTTAAVTFVPDVIDLMTVGARTDDLAGLPLVHLRQDPLTLYNAITKRIFDLVVGAIALCLASPFMVLIGLAIVLTDGFPLFYRQQRMGLDARRFTMLKFRTMRNDAESNSGAVWATRNDPRTTRLGRILRKLSLDELPQLLNVLLGHMSLVGPRPERPELIEGFKHHIPGYMLRHAMKAGMTGWAQINGWRGDTSLERRIAFDLYYIRHWSLLFDLWIIVLTPFRGFYHPNAG